MAGRRITKRTIDGLLPADSEYVLWDADLPGFGVRVRGSGAKSFIVQYRAGTGRKAPTRKLTLGPTNKLTAEEARALARTAMSEVAQGKDPVQKRTEGNAMPTVAELAEAFLAQHVEVKRKTGTAAHYSYILRRLVGPAVGRIRADRLERTDLAALHLSLKGTPYQANRVLAVVGSMYGFAGKQGLVGEAFNPARGIQRYREDGRERFLSTDELERLGAAIRKAETIGIDWEAKPTSKHARKTDRRTVIGPHVAAAFRLLLFTGCRLREILFLRWENIDFERGLLFLPDSKTGRRTVVLNAPALVVLAGLVQVGPFVIAGGHPSKPRSDIKRPWALVTRQAGLDDLRIHDLRHSFASFGAGGGLGLPIVGKLLGHANAATTARYAHLDADPLRRASERIGQTIATAMGENHATGTGVTLPFKR